MRFFFSFILVWKEIFKFFTKFFFKFFNYSIFIIYERDQAIDYGHTDNLHIAIGYLPNKNTNYSIQLDSIDNTKSNYVISKNINDFLIDFKLTNHLMRPDDYEEASFNLRRKF